MSTYSCWPSGSEILNLVFCSNNILNLKTSEEKAGMILANKILHPCIVVFPILTTPGHSVTLSSLGCPASIITTGEPVGNLTLIKVQSIAYYTNSTDRRELEVCLIDERYTQTIPQTTEPIISRILIMSTIFSIPAW